MKTRFLFFLLLSLIFIQCNKDEENLISSGIQTTVSGRLTDFNNSPIVNAKLKVGEYKQEWHNQGPNTGNYIDVFVQWLSTSETDSNGDYNFTFTTSGKGKIYKLALEDSSINEQTYWNCCLDNINIENIGGNFNFNYNQLAKLYPCDITFNLNNISDFPLYVNHETTFFDINSEINSNSQIVKRIYIIKNNNQTVKILRTKSNGIQQIATYTFPASNVEILTTQNITINESDFVNI